MAKFKFEDKWLFKSTFRKRMPIGIYSESVNVQMPLYIYIGVCHFCQCYASWVTLYIVNIN